MYDDVLLTTDGSENANRAFEHATALAERFDAELHVLFVINTADYGRFGEDNQILRKQEGRGEAVIEAIEEMARSHGLAVSTAVRRGTPADEIVTYADEADVDVVVMGTHGQAGDRERELIGGVADHVLRNSPVPVLTVGPSE